MERRRISLNFNDYEYHSINNKPSVKETVINFKRRKMDDQAEGEANVIFLEDGIAIEPETLEITKEEPQTHYERNEDSPQQQRIVVMPDNQVLEDMGEMDDGQGEFVLDTDIVAEELEAGRHPLDDLELEEGEIRGGNIGFVRYRRQYEKTYMCPLCEKSFTQKGNLMRHYHSHTGAKPFGCELCGHKFTQKSNLQKHIATHNGDKRFECGVCYKGFVQKANLVRHLRIHTGEKPFECHLCGHKFTQKGNLNKHMQLHSSTGDVTCNFCNTKFATYTAKLRHEKAAHRTKWEESVEEITIQQDYNCDECPARFKTFRALKRHRKYHE